MVARLLARRSLGLLLAILIPLSTVVHTGDEAGRASGTRLEAHHHGPQDPCPTEAVHACFACSPHRLLGTPASVTFTLPTLVELEARARVEARVGLVVSPRAVGRSPPSSGSV